MDNTLNATKFIFNQQISTGELERILIKITQCYNLMIRNNVELPNDENKIRDVLLLKYLKNDAIRRNLSLTDFLFERESAEDHSQGRTDITIKTSANFTTQNAYYIIECKRLDNKAKRGTSGLNSKYIVNGVKRFIDVTYSSYYRTNAMIGFIVEPMDIDSNVADINHLLAKNTDCNTTKEITKENFIEAFDYHYSSEHKTVTSSDLKLFHLMFDFSKSLKES